MEAEKIGVPGQCALVAAALLAVLGIFAFGVVLPQIATEFSDNPNGVLLSQLVAALVGFAFAIAAPLLGGLVRRFGYRAVYLWSAIMFSVAGTSVVFLHDIYIILATRLVLGFSVAGALVASLAGIGSLPAAQRARLFGLQAFAGALLSVIFAFVIGALARDEWRTPFYLYLAGFLMVPLIMTLPKRSMVPVASAAADTRALKGLSPFFLLLVAFVGMASILPGTFGPFYMVHLGITDPATIAIPLMACAGAAMIGAFGYGWFVQRVGMPGMFMLAFLIMGSGFMASGWAQTVPALAATLAVCGAGMALFTPNMNAAAVTNSNGDAAGAIGLVNGVLYGSQALFPFVSQGIRAQAGPSAVFTGFGLFGLLAGTTYAVRAIGARRRTTSAKPLTMVPDAGVAAATGK